MNSLKAQIEKYGADKAREYAMGDSDLCHFVDYKAGFQECLELMLPLIEALEFYKTPSWEDEPVGRAKELGKYADSALQSLAEKVQK